MTRWSDKLAKKHGSAEEPEKRKHKFGAERTEFSGYSFASKGEARLYAQLKLEERAGEIEIVQTQQKVELIEDPPQARIDYYADFVIFDKALGETVWIEYKGFETPEWRLKRRLWFKFGPGLLRIYKGSGDRIFIAEEIRGPGKS
jgi:hypothetical protein